MENCEESQKCGAEVEADDFMADVNAQEAKSNARWSAVSAEMRRRISLTGAARQQKAIEPKRVEAPRPVRPLPHGELIGADEKLSTPPDMGAVDATTHDAGGESTGDAELDRMLAEFDGTTAKVETGEPSDAAPKTTHSDPVAGLAASPASAAPPAPPVVLDPFPVSNLDDVPAFDDPVRELAALCRELQVHKDYPAVRARYCQLSIRMNLEGVMAPAFRPRPCVEAPKHDAVHMLMYRDRLVIDYYWCYAKRISLSPTDAGHAHLHDLETDFDFTAAWVLTGRNQTPKYRAAEALCLTPLQQCQTMKLHSQELCERLVRIYGVYRKSKGNTHSPLAKATTAIGKWAERDPRIEPYKVSYEKLWLAQEMLGADGIVQSIAELHALMLGAQPLARKTVADKLKRLTKNVGVALKPTSMP